MRLSVGPDTQACGEDGLEHGVATFDASYTDAQRQEVISEFANACALVAGRCN